MKGGGRRGRRTGAMVRIAHERIDDLFALAAREGGGDHPELADRYVRLARKVGARYNVRLPPEYRELYCRGCSSYWIEGRTVRTRLRAGRRVRTCLICGRARRGRLRPRPSSGISGPSSTPDRSHERAVAIAELPDRLSSGGSEEA